MQPTATIKPPFTMESALAKVKLAEDAWNSKDPERVALAYSLDSEWRNRTEFLRGREFSFEPRGSGDQPPLAKQKDHDDERRDEGRAEECVQEYGGHVLQL